MLLVLHRAMGTSQQEVEEHPMGATTELTLMGRVIRPTPDRESAKVSHVPGEEVVVVPWSPPQPWLVPLGRHHAVG